MKFEARVVPRNSLGPAQLTTTSNGSAVDTLGFNGCEFVIIGGAIGGTSPSFTFKFQDSDDGSTFADIDNSLLIGGASRASGQPAAITASSTIHYRKYIGEKRYVRIICSAVSGTSPTLYVCGFVNLTHAQHLPAD